MARVLIAVVAMFLQHTCGSVGRVLPAVKMGRSYQLPCSSFPLAQQIYPDQHRRNGADG
jgi:hypothetical protein